MREKLIELIGQVQDCGCDVTDVVSMNYVENNVLADHLIANGVTIQVRCKDCDWYRQHEDSICVNPKCGKSWYGCPVPPEHFCSYGERREGE